MKKAKAATEVQLEVAKALPAAYLRRVFNSPKAQNWLKMKLTEIVSSNKHAIKRGPFGGSVRKEIFVSSGYKVYEQQHAIKDDFSLGNYYIDPIFCNRN